MTLAGLLPVAVALPIAGAVVAPLVARTHRRAPLVIGMITLLGALALLIGVATRVYAGHGHTLTLFVSGERPQHGHALGIALVADPFGLAFALLAAALGTLLLLSALSELGSLGKRELGGLACLVLLLIAALIGVALAADTVDLFVWFEVSALASYGLTGFFLERPIALEAAFKAAVLTTTAGFAVFSGAGMLYSVTGALNLGQLHAAFGHGRAQAVAVALLVCGYATKAGLVPFHAWLPDMHTPVPGAVSALFSGLMVNLGVVALVRIALLAVPGMHALLGLLTALGIGSAVIGALLALVQSDLKRLLAWDTVSQMGILVVGYASHTPAGMAGATYHLINHGLFKALLFLCAGAIVHETGETDLAKMGGLARARPLLTAGFTVGCLAIAGIPPLNGYASLGLIHRGIRTQPVVYGLALVAQVITVAALGRAAYLAFYRPRRRRYRHLDRQHTGMSVSLLTLMTGCLAFGALASPLVTHIAAPAAALLGRPDMYAHAALGAPLALPASTLGFDYLNLADIGRALAEVAVGAALAVAVVRGGSPRLLSPLRRVHTGSVNDYALFAASGIVICSAVLLG